MTASNSRLGSNAAAGLENLLADSQDYYSNITKAMRSPLGTLDGLQGKLVGDPKREKPMLAGNIGDSVQVLPDAGQTIETIHATIGEQLKGPIPS